MHGDTINPKMAEREKLISVYAYLIHSTTFIHSEKRVEDKKKKAKRNESRAKLCTMGISIFLFSYEIRARFFQPLLLTVFAHGMISKTKDEGIKTCS